MSVIYVYWLFFYNVIVVNFYMIYFVYQKILLMQHFPQYMFVGFKHLLSEGCLYNIKKIKVVASKNSYTPLSNGFKLMFPILSQIRVLRVDSQN